MPQIPTGLEPFMLTASFSLTALLAGGLWWASGRAGLAPEDRIRNVVATAAVLLAWQATTMGLAKAGFFALGPDALGIQMAFAIVLPAIAGVAWINASPTMTRIVDAVPLGALVGVQVYRVIGALFVVLWLGGHLPGVFAQPAGFGDIAIGLAAPIVGWMAWRDGRGRSGAAVWNILGVADLVVAVSTGFLSSPGALQMLALETPNLLIARYPLALVPLYAVPVSLVLHALVWQRLRREAGLGQSRLQAA
jgi:hypothetical protein